MVNKTITVDMVYCDGCEECLHVCPTDAISLLARKAIIEPEKCNLCGACVTECPVRAITLK